MAISIKHITDTMVTNLLKKFLIYNIAATLFSQKGLNPKLVVQ